MLKNDYESKKNSLLCLFSLKIMLLYAYLTIRLKENCSRGFVIRARGTYNSTTP